MSIRSSADVAVASSAAHRLADFLIGNQRSLEALRRAVLWLSISQFFAIVVAAVAAKAFYIDFLVGPHYSILLYVVPAVFLAMAFHIFSNLLRLHQIDVLLGRTIWICAVWGALALSFLVLLGGMYLLKLGEMYSRGWFLTWFALSAVSLVAIRSYAIYCIRGLFETRRLSRYFAIYGTPDYVNELKTRIENSVPFAAVTGIFVEQEESEGARKAGSALDELRRAAAEGIYEKVVIGLPASEVGTIRAATRALAPYTSELLLCTHLDELPLPIHGSYAFGNTQAVVLSPIPDSEVHSLSKRILDAAFASIALAAIAPVLLLVAIAIKIDSRGPVFFRQRRYGQNNEVFRIFKFRTMNVVEDGAHIEQARVGDVRITRLGRILRATSIDELPQLINVLMGHMSLVGPRPHALAHEERFERERDLFSRRRRVLPGLTGWAQVNGFRGETRTQEQLRKRMEYDLYYIDNWSIWFDIEIIARTVVTVTRGAV